MRKVCYYSNLVIDGVEVFNLTHAEFASLVIEDNEEAIELVSAGDASLGIYTRKELKEEGLLG